MSSNKKTIINVICSIMVLFTNVIINFFLSPYIVKNIGVEANGFIILANNFVMYAQLIVAALNSMAGRFISIEYIRGNYKKANLYYNSVFWGNLIIVAILIIPAIISIYKLDMLIDIPPNILFDVKLLFGFVFFNFFITTGLPNWDCGTYISNRLDRSYIPQMITSILRCVLIFGMFTLLTPKVYYVGLIATIVTILLLICNAYNTHKLTPELKISLNIKKIIFSGRATKELVESGIWNTISSVGNILLSGLDLIICNIFLGATSMGVLSLAKIIPNYMQQLSASLRGAVAPELTINYALEKKDEIFKSINKSMKLTSVIMTIPIAIIVVLGDSFFALWVPSQDAKLLAILSVLSILGYMFTSGTQILYNVFEVANKVKENSIAMIISGIISITITILLAKFSKFGIFAVAGVSTLINLIRNMTFTLPATAKYLGFKWNIFYKQVIQTIISSILLICCGYIIKMIIPSNTWIMFIICGSVIGVIGILINGFLILNKEERIFLANKILNKIKKLKN